MQRFVDILQRTLGDMPRFVDIFQRTLGDMPRFDDILQRTLGDMPRFVDILQRTLGDMPRFVDVLQRILGDMPRFVDILQRTLGDMPRVEIVFLLFVTTYLQSLKAGHVCRFPIYKKYSITWFEPALLQGVKRKKLRNKAFFIGFSWKCRE